MTDSESASKGIVSTFYSYKGGVGRSMALANVAVLMAQWGYRVLIVDWDLEAPGLDRYLEDLAPGGVKRAAGRNGIVDIATAVSEGQEADWKDCVVSFSVPGTNQHLDFISAGRPDGEYARRLQKLDWDALFERHDFGSRLEAIRNEWRRTYDHVLIDSRTGITDIGGICTIYLPDVLVAMFVANHQSLEGVADVVGRARLARSGLPVDRAALLCVPVPARDESRTEYEKAQEWRRNYEQLLAPFYNDFLPRNVSPGEALDVMRIPYLPYWSFGEHLPVLAESASDPNLITYYYTILGRLLTTGLSWRDSAPPDASLSSVGTIEGKELGEYRTRIAAPRQLDSVSEADVAFLVELGGSASNVERRVDLVHWLINRLRASPQAKGIRAAVFGYRDHGGPYRLGAIDDYENLVIGMRFDSLDAAAVELDREEFWQAERVFDKAAAPIEDALRMLMRSSSWRPGIRHVLCTVGSRPPHPPRIDPLQPMMTPCTNGYAWETDLATLRAVYSAMCFAVLDAQPGHGSRYAERAWAQLGAQGTFRAETRRERVLQAIVSQPAGQSHESTLPRAHSALTSKDPDDER